MTIPSFRVFMESFNPFSGVDPSTPPHDFKLVHSDEANSDDNAAGHEHTKRTYQFKGVDGRDRHLRVHISNSTPHDKKDNPAGVVFSMHAAPHENYDEMNGSIDKHGRGGDVMQAVAHTIKDHMQRTQATDLSWMASGAKHRMYRALFNKMRLNSFRFTDEKFNKHGNGGGAIGMLMRNY